MNPNDPKLRSFIHVPTDSHFPIRSLPFGIVNTADDQTKRVGVAIGDQVLDLALLEQAGLLSSTSSEGHVFCRDELNAFIKLGRAAWGRVRTQVSELLRHDNPA